MDFSNRLSWRKDSCYCEHLGLHYVDVDKKQVWCLQLVDKHSGTAHADLVIRGGIVERFATAETCRKEAEEWCECVIDDYRKRGYLFFAQMYGHMERVRVIARYDYGAYDVERVADGRCFRISGFECASDIHND